MKMSRQRQILRWVLACICLPFLLGGAAHARDSDPDYEWIKSCDVDCILISLADQRMDVFGDHKLIAWSTISTGRSGYPTPTGIFLVTEKDRDHHSNLYHNAPMPFFMRLTDGGVGMHAGVLPGYPASHGCIRLPEEMARELYLHVEPGAFVQVIDGPISSILAPPRKAGNAIAND